MIKVQMPTLVGSSNFKKEGYLKWGGVSRSSRSGDSLLYCNKIFSCKKNMIKS